MALAALFAKTHEEKLAGGDDEKAPSEHWEDDAAYYAMDGKFEQGHDSMGRPTAGGDDRHGEAGHLEYDEEGALYYNDVRDPEELKRELLLSYLIVVGA